ncbi:unnamed protein product [marine sediment metagenome]|uniref:Uncharacterized protein n=1 Tax=marine sediment metagenome TaxID=412755 RepID=X0ZH35_9ZZZZ
MFNGFGLERKIKIMPYQMNPFYSTSGKMCPVGYCPKCKRMSWFDIQKSSLDSSSATGEIFEFYICVLCNAVFNPKEIKLEPIKNDLGKIIFDKYNEMKGK